MSKKMTPCEKLGYKVGDDFIVIEDSFKFRVGSIISLQEDDGTSSPFFTNESVKDEYPSGVSCFLASIKKVAKLKPAKQALADAIHQSGGLRHGAEYAAQDKCAQVTMFRSKPIRHGNTWLDDEGFDDVGGFGCDKIQNWRQCILSRDEYFAAYPEQVKVEICNETKHKVEAEMTSDKEITIKVSDWHKNGELPPIGEVCIFDPAGGECYFNDDELKAKGRNVYIIAHTNYKKASGSVAVFKWDLDDCCGVSSANACSFRPLRTEREKAIDEMIKVINRYDYYGSLNFDVVASDIANAMFDEGYRKEVK